MLEEALLGAVLGGAGQTREVDEDGHLSGRVLESLRGQIEVEAHFTFGGGGGVGELEELTAEGGDGGFCCDGHGGYYSSGVEWDGVGREDGKGMNGIDEAGGMEKRDLYHNIQWHEGKKSARMRGK